MVIKFKKKMLNKNFTEYSANARSYHWARTRYQANSGTADNDFPSNIAVGRPLTE